jgi:peptide/nickel transport system substrate-binding protein
VDVEIPFGRWLKLRRKSLDLTQQELARRVGCATVTIRKFESGEIRPSRQIAERLAAQLALPSDEQATFVRFARGMAELAPSETDSASFTQQSLEEGHSSIARADTASQSEPAASDRSFTLRRAWNWRSLLAVLSAIIAVVSLVAVLAPTMQQDRLRLAVPGDSRQPIVVATATETSAAMSTGRGSAGELRIVMAVPHGTITSLNPYLGDNLFVLEPARLALEPLAAVQPNGTLVPILAAEIPTIANGGVSADLRTVTWKLRRDVLWSDGLPFTAADVAFTYRYCSDTHTSCISSTLFHDAERVEQLDAGTVRISWQQPHPDPYRLFVGSQGLILQERQFAGCIGTASATESRCVAANLAPLGTGPFLVRGFTPDREARFALNQRFRDTAAPAFVEVHLRFVADPLEAALSVFERGEEDYAMGIEADAPTLANLIERGRGRLIETPTSLVERLLLNQSDPDPALGEARSDPGRPHPFLADVRVRRALALAIDRRLLATAFYERGVAGQATCELVVTAPYHEPGSLHGERRACEPDLDGARRLLDAAGWRIGPDGIRERNNLRLQVVLMSTVKPARQRAQELIRDAWRAIGVAVELRSVEAPRFFGQGPDSLEHFPADALLFASGSDTADQTEYLCQWTSKLIPQRKNGWRGTNYERYSNAEYDILCARLRVETDPAERAALTWRMNDLLVDEAVTVPLVAHRTLSARAAGLRGPAPGPWDAQLWNVAAWTKES